MDSERDGIYVASLLASFCHLRDTGAHRRAARFVAFARRIMRGEYPSARQSTTNTL